MHSLPRTVLTGAAAALLASCVSGDLSKDRSDERGSGASGATAAASNGKAANEGTPASIAGQSAMANNGFGAANPGASGSALLQAIAGAGSAVNHHVSSTGGRAVVESGGYLAGGGGSTSPTTSAGELGGVGNSPALVMGGGESTGAPLSTSGIAATGGVATGGTPGTGGVSTGGTPSNGGAASGVTGVAGSVGGAGAPTLCSPNRSFCRGNDIHICSTDGSSSTKAAGCLSTQYCDDATATCVEVLCKPFNQPSCDGNIATTCNANGSGFTGTRIACGTSGQTCSHGQCFSQMVDTVGDAIELSPQLNMWGGSEVLVVYSMASTRYLLKVEQYGTIPKGVATTCSVYESDTKTGPFYLKDPGKGGTSIATTGDVTWGWQPCGFDPPVELTAGKYYAIGLASAVSNSNYFPILWSQQAGTYQTTFGTAYSRTSSIRSTSVTVGGGATQIPDQRLTTVP